MQRRGFSRRPMRAVAASERTRFRTRVRTQTHARTQRFSRGNIQEKERRTERSRGVNRVARVAEREESAVREREREVDRIVVYLHAPRYNTSELIPPTHRRHLRGLSYGDIFDRAIIPNTIYTARARRDARTNPAGR